MKKIFTLVATTLFAFGGSAYAQQLEGHLDHPDGHRDGEEVNYCAKLQYEEKLLNLRPELRQQAEQDRRELSEWTRDFAAQRQESGQRGANYVIPIVFHIIEFGGPENISDAQVYDALEVLNRDFNLQNADANNVVSFFQGWPADAHIEFRLAQKKPNGQCFKGITRTYDASSVDGAGGGWTNDQMAAVEDEHGTFPGDEYMNVYIVAFADGAAGYTTTPNNWQGGSMFNGIIILHNYVGRIGTGNLNRSRALTHEVGHWLNLDHPWGPNNNPGNSSSCGDDDDVDDTPNTIGHTSCALTANTCSNESSYFGGTDPIDNVENYMDYSYCSKMFTPGQVTRMEAALNSGTGGRNQLWQANNLIATGTDGNDILCEAEFEVNSLVICAGDTVDFTDLSFHNPTTWDWTFTGGTPATANTQNPSVAYNTPGTYNVSLTVGNGGSTTSASEIDYITVLPSTGAPAPFSEGFESGATVPNADWLVDNPDGIGWTVVNNAAFDGTYSIRLNNYSNSDGALDAFESTSYDLTALSNVVLTFNYSYVKRQNSNNERLKIYVSNDCGNSWSLRKQLAGSQLPTGSNSNSPWVPSSQSDWEEVTIDNISSAYLVENFRFKFEFESNEGNNIYIDNINLGVAASIAEEGEQIGSFNVYPNPLENGSVVTFDLTETNEVIVELYNAMGQKVVDLGGGYFGAGEHRVLINSAQLSAGFYFVKLSVGNNTYTKKVLVK